ncbi:MAG TPA: hypothetical protein VKU93_03295 [Terracidiphilus sp.]|nr:hypothetical protein [Terracidiphilus sp.]
MRLRFFPQILAAFVCSLAVAAYSQVSPAASESSGLPITVGVGANYMNRSFDDGSVLGETLWIDMGLPVSGRLRGLGLEIEGEQIGTTKPTNYNQQREQVAAGGVTYSFYNFRRFQPHVKFMEGFGNAEYAPDNHPFNQTRTVTIAGGGFTYPLAGRLSARVDYEYQWWPNFWVKPPTYTTGAALTPSGVSFGIAYQISPFRRHF